MEKAIKLFTAASVLWFLAGSCANSAGLSEERTKYSRAHQGVSAGAEDTYTLDGNTGTTKTLSFVQGGVNHSSLGGHILVDPTVYSISGGGSYISFDTLANVC